MPVRFDDFFQGERFRGSPKTVEKLNCPRNNRHQIFVDLARNLRPVRVRFSLHGYTRILTERIVAPGTHSSEISSFGDFSGREVAMRVP